VANNKDIKKQKGDIVKVISEWKTFCNDFPTLNVDFSLPSINSDFDVIEFLLDLISTLLGKASDELQEEVIRWLIDKIGTIDIEFRVRLKRILKSCYVCKINPDIPEWMYVTNPLTNQPGVGMNIEINSIDFQCLFANNPESEGGKLLYGGFNDMNRFLFDVIQSPTPLVWQDPVTNKSIATFEFIEQGAFVDNSNEEGSEPQDTNIKNNVLNIKVDNSYASPEKNLLDFIYDYINSVNLIDTQQVLTQSMDLLFGVVTNQISVNGRSKGEDCVRKSVEFDEAINKVAQAGINDPTVVIDNSFFEFNQEETKNIQRIVRDRINGIFQYRDCGGTFASIDFNTISNLNDSLNNTTDDAVKVDIITKSFKDIADTTSNTADSEEDKESSKYNFIKNLLKALKLVFVRIFFSPKVAELVSVIIYMIKGKIANRTFFDRMNDFLCLIKNIWDFIVEKLVKELLLPMLLRGLRTFIKCVIKAKLKEKVELQKRQRLALLGIADIPRIDSVINTAIDFGFDSLESNINKNN
jgi:hypothetical protein